MSDVLGVVAGDQGLRQKQRTGREQRNPTGPSAQGQYGICL
jgi:hypothetical protein